MISTLTGLLLAYLMGSVPTGFLVGKMVKGVDIRQHGSKNMGATNIFRVIGPAWGIFVLMFDILKGYLAVRIIFPLFMNAPDPAAALFSRLLIGFSAIAGHNWTVFLKFKGGKGVATTCGVFMALVPLAVWCALAVWVITVVITKYVSASSILAALSCPLWIWLFYRKQETFSVLIGVAIAVPILIIYTHRANIRRLREGKESKITDSSKRI